MKLYHFTAVGTVLPIKQQELLPRPHDVLSPTTAVVWLTTQPDMSLSIPERNALAELTGQYETTFDAYNRLINNEIESLLVRPCRQWWYGRNAQPYDMKIDGREITVTCVPTVSDLMRLTVQVPSHDRKLQRYATWRGRSRHPYVRVLCDLPFGRKWYIYTGTIKPRAITEITEALTAPID